MTSISALKEEYKSECTLHEAICLAVKLLSKNMDDRKPTAARFEMGVVTKDAHGQVV